MNGDAGGYGKNSLSVCTADHAVLLHLGSRECQDAPEPGVAVCGEFLLQLVIINGILSFILTPGSAWLAVAGTGQEASRFWEAFFNPTYWPSPGPSDTSVFVARRCMGSHYRHSDRRIPIRSES